MSAPRVLVNSPFRAVRDFIGRTLADTGADVLGTEPGDGFIRDGVSFRPDVAVMDESPGRRETADLEIDVLCAVRPDLRIVRFDVTRPPSALEILGRIGELSCRLATRA